MNYIGIFGSSGLAREVGDIVTECGATPIYILQNDDHPKNHSLEAIRECEIDKHQINGFTIGIGGNSIRKRIATQHSHLNFINIIHPAATLAGDQKSKILMSKGTIIYAGARISVNIDIGDFCIFSPNSTIGHDVCIGNFVCLAPGAHISGNVHLCDEVWVGAGAVITQGTPQNKLTVGSHTIIGAGAAVIKPCDPNAVYVGTPAKRIK